MGEIFSLMTLPTKPPVFDTQLGYQKATLIRQPVQAEPSAQSSRASGGRRLWVEIGLLLLAFTIAGYFYYQYRQATTGSQAEGEITDLVAELSVFMDLPAGETPTLATVSDKSKLEGQVFFIPAENGDKVLIYSTAGKAYLYRPSTGKLINYSSIQMQSETDVVGKSSPGADRAVLPNPSGNSGPSAVTEMENRDSAQSTVEPIRSPDGSRIAIYNGTSRDNLAGAFEKSFFTNDIGLQVAEKANAVRNDYIATIVVDVNGKRTSVAQAIAKRLGVSLSNLPEGESRPDVDILIILGSDRL